MQVFKEVRRELWEHVAFEERILRACGHLKQQILLAGKLNLSRLWMCRKIALVQGHVHVSFRIYVANSVPAVRRDV